MMAVIFALTSIAVIPFGNSIPIFVTTFRCKITDVKHRAAAGSGRDLNGGVRGRAGGVVLE